MEIKSVSKPLPSALESARSVQGKQEQRVIVEGTLGQDSDAGPSLAAKHFLVRGKRSETLKKPASNFLETIINSDDRQRILETSKQPWRMICSLDIEGPLGNFGGTGWMIGPKTVLTAGHCVHETNQMGGWAKKIRVSPGRNGAERPYGTVEATKFTSVDTWINSQDPDFDMGCIHLAEPIGDRTGWFSIGALPDDELQNSMVNISGYPADKSDGEQWFNANRVLRVGPRRVFYDVDTYGGQSGAPVWIYQGESQQPLGIAIHAYGTSATPSSFNIVANSAPRFIPEVLDQIRAWIAADSATS